MAASPPDAAPAPPAVVKAPPAPPPCPARTQHAPGPLGTTPLDVWRSRAELPECIAQLVPPDVDFSREMLAGDLPTHVSSIDLRIPATPPRRSGTTLVIEEQAPFEPCPPCRGVEDERMIAPAKTLVPAKVWRIPRANGARVFHRLLPAPGAGPCPPPVCS